MPITDAELALAKEGKFLEFWRSRHLAGDPVARTALTGWGDPDFVGAELSEKLATGMNYHAAHAAALQKYRVSPFSVYHPDVIKSLPGAFNSNWRGFWGIK